MRVLAPLLAVGLSALLAQSAGGAKKKPKTRTQSDGGVIVLGPDPPGKLRPDDPIPDGGLSTRVTAVADAGVSNGQQAQIDQLKAQIAALQQQVDNTSSQNQQLQQTNAQLAALRDQLQQAENQRVAREQDIAARRQAVQSAIQTLGAAQQSLAGGDYEIGAALDQAAAAFTGQAQQDVQAARTALYNRDLAQARAYLNSAISEAQQGR